MGVILFLVVVISISCLILSICSAYLKSTEYTLIEDDPSYIELGSYVEEREKNRTYESIPSGDNSSSFNNWMRMEEEEEEEDNQPSSHNSTTFFPQISYLKQNKHALKAHRFSCCLLSFFISIGFLQSSLISSFFLFSHHHINLNLGLCPLLPRFPLPFYFSILK